MQAKAIQKDTSVKIKMYGTWKVWKNVKNAINDLLSWSECCEGAERDRYMGACFRIKHGERVIDTDLC